MGGRLVRHLLVGSAPVLRAAQRLHAASEGVLHGDVVVYSGLRQLRVG